MSNKKRMLIGIITVAASLVVLGWAAFMLFNAVKLRSEAPESLPGFVEPSIGASENTSDTEYSNSTSDSRAGLSDYSITDKGANEIITKDPPIKYNGKEFSTPTDEEFEEAAQTLTDELGDDVPFKTNELEVVGYSIKDIIQSSINYVNLDITIGGFNELAELASNSEITEDTEAQLQLCLERLTKSYESLGIHTERVKAAGNKNLTTRWGVFTASLDEQASHLKDIKDMDSLKKVMPKIKYLDLNIEAGKFCDTALNVYTEIGLKEEEVGIENEQLEKIEPIED